MKNIEKNNDTAKTRLTCCCMTSLNCFVMLFSYQPPPPIYLVDLKYQHSSQFTTVAPIILFS